MTFIDVIGQRHVVQTLTHAVEGRRIAHAYLFSGMRGVGKTTVARILAKALNCHQGPTSEPCTQCPSCLEIANGQSFDVIEIDGASNNSVDDVRSIRETIRTRPVRGSYRLYIIDEVHMLSTSAFNALLKTLEEPPAHVVFIFATTEVHKIPQTIMSRCQHFSFRRIPSRTIADHLRRVADHDGIAISPQGLEAVARAADGSLRDALSLLDQIVAFAGETVGDPEVDTVLGNVPRELRREMLTSVINQDPSRALEVVWAVEDQGCDLHRFLQDLIEDVRSLLVVQIAPTAADRLDIADSMIPLVHDAASRFSAEELRAMFETLTKTQDQLRYAQNPSYVLEMAVVKVCGLSAVGLTSSVQGNPDEKQSVTSANHDAASRPHPSPQAVSTASKPDSPKKPSGQTALPAAAQAGPLHVDWRLLIERVAAEKPNLASYLEAGVPVKVEESLVMIAFQESADMCREALSRDPNRLYVQNICREMIGTALELKFVKLAGSNESITTLGHICRQTQQDRAQRLREQALAHPSVQMALEAFGGTLNEVREDSA